MNRIKKMAIAAAALLGLSCTSTTQPDDGGFSRPVADIANAGGYSPSSGADLWAMLDEPAPDDGDTTRVTTTIPAGVLAASFEEKLSDLGADWNPDLGVTVRVVARRADANGGDLTQQIFVKQGATQIAESGFLTLTGTYATQSLVLTQAQINAITDPGDLRVQVVGRKPDSSKFIAMEHRVTQIVLDNS